MARLRAFLDEVETKLQLVHAEASTKVVFGFGTKDIDGHDGNPRVVWIPTTAGHAPAEKQQAGPGAGKSVLTRTPTVVAHCRHDSFDETEELVHQVILALRAAGLADANFLGEEWPAEDIQHNGAVAFVSFSIKVPVTKAPLQKVQATTLEKDTTGAAPGDGNLDWGEP